MNKDYLKQVFSRLPDCEAWTLQIIQVKNSVGDRISYVCREIQLDPVERLLDYIENISNYYCSANGIDDFTSVDNYTGDVVGHVIYKLEKTNQLISHEYEILIQSTSSPDRETPIKDIKPNAAIFKGTVNLPSSDVSGNEDVPVMLVSMQKPMTALSNKFLMTSTGKFHEIDAPVLSLRKTMDVAIIGNNVYLFTLAGEKLFNMERTYKAVCKAKVDEIIKCDFLSDNDGFITYANSGRNPRRFVSYNNSHYEWLKIQANRQKAAEIFGLEIIDGSIKTDDSISVEELVKFLCNKAMLDPCDDSPVEVASTKPWR